MKQSTQPFLRWAGGKTQMLKDLEVYVPQKYNQYFEPFLGGGALFFSLAPENAFLSDTNEELINAYKTIKSKPKKLIEELKKYKNTEEFYYKMRAKKPEKLDNLKRAARMIFLNKTCFNGLYRVNKQGEFNVPYGRLKNPKICDEERIMAVSRALKGTKIICDNYANVVSKYAQKGDFVFFDPPYYPVGGYSDFQRYTKEFFYEEDQVDLRNLVCELVDKGVNVLLTNSNTEFVRKLYDGFEYKAVNTRRSISCNAKTRTGQDLMVIGTPKKKRTPSYLTLKGEQILEHFPGTRYMGSKYRVLPFIWDCVKDLPFESVLDAFSGSSCVSYMFKQYGKQVMSNDYMHFSHNFAKAIIENSRTKLTKQDVAKLIQTETKTNKFISKTFKGLYFSDKDNEFLDIVRTNIDKLENKYKRALALSALSRACLKRRARGIFTYVGDKYDDGRKDMQMSLREHFLENVEAFNKAVFSNGMRNKAFNSDVYSLDVKPDLVYLDPPYLSKSSDNDYVRRYHFVEGLVRNWQGVEIQQHTKTKKFKKYDTPFQSKATIYKAFENIFEKYKDSIIVVSYSSNSIPDKSEIVGMLEKHKNEVIVHQIEHLYSFGTHSHKVGKNANKVNEYVFVAY